MEEGVSLDPPGVSWEGRLLECSRQAEQPFHRLSLGEGQSPQAQAAAQGGGQFSLLPALTQWGAPPWASAGLHCFAHFTELAS